jgi:TPP-dependent pyruvate/acetoin dehydrogenase alpha subunit
LLGNPNSGAIHRCSDDDLGLMLLIRNFEKRLLELYAANKVGGTTHTCLGQEYVPVALGPLLTETDFVFSNHRGHGHYLARFRDPGGLLGEILGRESGVCRGVGGSQHIWRDGRYVSTGVQGESVPVAVGVALRFKTSGRRDIALAYVGDGTWGEGALYEALNIASLWKAPLVLVVENNGIAQTTPIELNMAGTVEKRAAAFDIPYVLVNSVSVKTIREQLAERIAEIRERPRPLIVEFQTGRLGPHSKGDDTRSPEDLARILAADWYTRYREEFPDQLQQVEARTGRELDDVFATVEASAMSAWEPQ